MRTNFKDIKELTEVLSPYISATALARICDINEGQMRQYVAGVRNPSKQTIEKINKKIHVFAEKLREFNVIVV
ncbi:helix-turn-helix transcriptional regulator [uncultured Bacteroides sp.]|uniref:helix-turn-helix domain-containing protein n=1 Tax=uncultured Bacteroides sp. TaxID=162156 RepID=UPI0025E1382C|nr:helix-turn-helix transcriptional regulator [uncultured Bacteroides sp.]